MEEDFIEQVYMSLQGMYVEPVDGVESLFYPGSKCETYLFQMRDAYTNVCERLGQPDDDADIEEIIRCLMNISEELGRHMYLYGHKFSGREI